MNLAELSSRVHMLEKKVEKLSPTIVTAPKEDSGLAVSGISSAIALQLIGLTTAQRTSLGVTLASLPAVKHILVYDTEDQAFYTWSGTEWV